MAGDWTGIHVHGSGWRAVVSLGRGRPPLRRWFPQETPVQVMQAWRRDEAAAAHVSRKRRATRGSFAGDAKRYLDAVKALPTYKERVRDIGLWVTEFQTRQRDGITSAEIRAIRDRWLTEPRAKGQPPYAASTVNHRLRALSNLYTVLDGRGRENPVRDVDEAPEPDPRPQAVSYAIIGAILKALPNRGRPAKGDNGWPKVSQSKIRLRCLAYSQITPKQLSQLQPADLALAQKRLRLPARGKGRGAAALWVTLVPEAVAAFRDFDAQKLYGPFSHGSLSKSWRRAIKAAKVPHVMPYQLRHTFGSLIYRATKSRDAVQRFLQHASWETSERYTLDAEDAVQAAYAQAIEQHWDKSRR